MNKAILIGNLTRDPETRALQSGVSVCTFTLAINRRFTNAQGVREADFINIVTWRQLADLCGRYLSKGRKCAVIGSIQTRSYDAQDGSKRYVTEVVADEVEFLTGPQEGGRSPRTDEIPLPPEPFDNGSQSAAPQAGPAAPARSSEMQEVDDDELPF